MERVEQDEGREESRARAHDFDADLVEYVVLAFPDLKAVAGTAPVLDRLVAESRIRILDLVVITTGPHGEPLVVHPGTEPDLAPLEDVEGETGGLLGEDDVALAADALPPRSTALVMVIEDVWAEDLAAAARSMRGRIVGGERIPRRRLQGLRASGEKEVPG